MTPDVTHPGALMAAEIAQAPAVFAAAASADHRSAVASCGLDGIRAIHTVARGSSDAAANILSYLFMRHLRIPVTSLPPSTFSLYPGVDCADTAALVISQSGASQDLVACAKGIRGAGGKVIAITNQPGSAVEAHADITLPIAAGPERAVPATKSVIGAIGAGMALMAAMRPAYRDSAAAAAQAMRRLGESGPADLAALQSGLSLLLRCQ